MQEPNRSPRDDAGPAAAMEGAGPDAGDPRVAPEVPPVYEVQELPLERRLVQDRRGRGARALAVVDGAAPVTERRSGERRDRRR